MSKRFNLPSDLLALARGVRLLARPTRKAQGEQYREQMQATAVERFRLECPPLRGPAGEKPPEPPGEGFANHGAIGG